MLICIFIADCCFFKNLTQFYTTIVLKNIPQVSWLIHVNRRREGHDLILSIVLHGALLHTTVLHGDLTSYIQQLIRQHTMTYMCYILGSRGVRVWTCHSHLTCINDQWYAIHPSQCIFNDFFLFSHFCY